jgi:outer membrane protein OmpA-like peptidoglycan-associated protein
MSVGTPATAWAIHAGIGLMTLGAVSTFPAIWERAAAQRLVAAEAQPTDDAPIAADADEGYCSAELKKVLRRVAQSCGLVSEGGGRGCQPLEAKSVATLSGSDFNALFAPLSQRAGILQFEQDSDALDADDQALLDKLFADQRGASWFFVVARSSPEGSEVYNRDLSQRRGGAVLRHLQETFEDPDLDKEVGLLWLGEEFAQLDDEFCGWQRSGGDECTPRALNRSAFVAWIDCRL